MVERAILYSAYPALKHGGYSGMTLLPGEDEAEFQKLHEAVIAEYDIDGPSEHAIALKFAHATWREQHLEIYGYAAQARKRHSEILSELMPPPLQQWDSSGRSVPAVQWDPEKVSKAEKAAEKQARKELGSAWRLVEMGDVLTLDHLYKEEEIAERMSRRKERLLKQLLLVKGVKSMSVTSPASVSPPLIGNAG
jgi:hypothetical protein